MVEELYEHIVPHPPFRCGAASDKGKVRDKNEDRFIVEPEAGVFIVSDGIGGHRGGEIASNIVAQDLSVIIETGLNRPRTKDPKTIKSLLKRAVLEQNRQLLMEAESESGYEDMGATLVAVIIKAGRAYIANLGDSRVYRLRKGRLVQLTKDHSVVSELVRKGTIEPEQAEDHEASGQITHYIGMEEKPVPYIHSFTLKGKDRLLLCTDGLTDMVDAQAIAAILKEQTDPQSTSVQLVNAANEAGGFDNITAVIVDWPGS